ncbi:MAG: hypothetical protein U0946_06435 [Patescibacteria group bacterium]|nr:hypothetical protein [Patescibacteria group bacterium]
MCLSTDNSLEQNLAAQTEMLRSGKFTPDEILSLATAAIKAEKTYQTIMQQSGWSPEQLFKITGYRILNNFPLTPPSHS